MTLRRREIDWLDKNFKLLEDAALAGDRCPQSHPHGPIDSGAITELVRVKRIRSEVYAHNYRVVTILVGPHKGKSTAPAAPGLAPYRINGVRYEL
jgi:hypothetical protein